VPAVIYIRSLLYLVLLALSVLVVCFPIVILGRLAPYPAIGNIGKRWAYWNLGALKWVCGLEVRLHGLENIPDAPVVILAKHQSAWETLALRAILPITQTWVLKRELMWVPVFGWALAAFKPIAIDRKAGMKSVKKLLEEGKQWLDSGRAIVIFPEGTRVPPGERRPYGIGGALLAERSGRPVLPIAHNAGVFWPRRSIAKYPGVIDLVFGPLIQSSGRKAKEINRDTERWIEETVAGLPTTRAPKDDRLTPGA
jgi:1-acyl-sn-glycerol-3-phosphate acyltransferase